MLDGVDKGEGNVIFQHRHNDSVDELSRDRRIIKGLEEIGQILMAEAKNETDMR